MTSENHSAFLNCPISRATQLGGTPRESGGAGGQFKKAANDPLMGWQHAAEVLPEWMHGSVRPTACDDGASQRTLFIANGNGAAINLPVEITVPIGLVLAGVVGRREIQASAIAREAGIAIQVVQLLGRCDRGEGHLRLLPGGRDVQDAIKAPLVGKKLASGDALDVQLALVGDPSAGYPVADRPLSDSGCCCSQRLVAVESSKFGWAHGAIMALAIW